MHTSLNRHSSKGKNMKNPAVLLSLALFAVPAFPADEPQQEKKLTPQQAKMKKCSADAKTKGLKGEEYKNFRNECLKAK
jgi:hypothetical protein